VELEGWVCRPHSSCLAIQLLIPILQGRGQNADLNPRYSRLGFMTYTPTPINDWTVQTKLEMDFFNGNTSGAFGSYPIRLRFAYLDWGYFRVGNDASVFMDYDVFPNVLDYEGPPGMVLMRQALFRITVPLGDQVHWAMAVEQPFSDITPSEGGKNIQDLPDFKTHIRYDAGLGHVQLSGVIRKITNQPLIGPDQSLFGWGLNLTGDFHLWAYLNGVNPASKSNPACRTVRLVLQRGTKRESVGGGTMSYCLLAPNSRIRFACLFTTKAA
jgi:hypothetical protein